MNHTAYKRAFAFSCLLILSGPAGLFPMDSAIGNEAMQIHRTVQKEIDVHRKVQDAESQWAEQKDELIARYRQLSEQKDQLEKRNAALAAELASRRKMVAEADRKIVETNRVKTQLHSTLELIVSRLAEFIQTDLPFLASERSRRLEELTALLAKRDEVLSEKCRRTVEALQVETEYGSSLQVMEQTIALDDLHVAVEVLRVGRLALFFRTPDGQTVGWYNRAAKKWEMLPGKYNRSINHAAEMATRQRPMDLVELPLGRIVVQ